MLKLLLLTLGTWSVLSLSLVGSLGFLLQLRQQRACAMGASAGGANLRAGQAAIRLAGALVPSENR